MVGLMSWQPQVAVQLAVEGKETGSKTVACAQGATCLDAYLGTVRPRCVLLRAGSASGWPVCHGPEMASFDLYRWVAARGRCGMIGLVPE